MPDNRITNYFKPVSAPATAAPETAPASAPRPARTRPVVPELQAHAARPGASGTPNNRAYARADLGAKLAAFSQRVHSEQARPSQAAPPAPTNAQDPELDEVANARAQLAEAAAEENAINLAMRHAKISTMGLKAAKDIVG